jgi:hypothetical protein
LPPLLESGGDNAMIDNPLRHPDYADGDLPPPEPEIEAEGHERYHFAGFHVVTAIGRFAPKRNPAGGDLKPRSTISV